MFNRFLTATRSSSDAQNIAKDSSFIELTRILQNSVKRSLKQPELSAVWSLSDAQTEVITNLLKEARDGETTST